MLAVPVKLSQQANAIQEVLTKWANPRGGVVVVTQHLKQMWEVIYDECDAPRLIVCYGGEVDRGDWTNRVDRTWLVAVCRGSRGFLSCSCDGSPAKPKGDAEPFMDSLEEVRDLCRVMIGISEENPLAYRSCKPIQTANVATDAYLVEFSTANDISAVTPDNPSAEEPEET